MSLIEMPKIQDLTGRILAINPQVCQRFSCGGFQLALPSRPFGTVSHESQQEPLRRALIEGRLIDITDQNLTGLRQGDTFHTPAKESADKGIKVYLQVGSDGSLLVVSPKDDEEEKKFEQEIKESGHIIPSDFKVAEARLDGFGARVDSAQAESILSSLSNNISSIRKG
jgi:hypothetical protein